MQSATPPASSCMITQYGLGKSTALNTSSYAGADQGTLVIRGSQCAAQPAASTTGAAVRKSEVNPAAAGRDNTASDTETSSVSAAGLDEKKLKMPLPDHAE